jgi:hypothetical protein
MCFTQDVKAVLDWGFDGIKLDGCGKQENVELWYNLFNWTATMAKTKGVVIENCHNGPRQGSPASISPFGPHVPTADWCPFHYYRSSTDIRPVYGSILNNLETIPPLAAANLSRPGCYAYPDVRCAPRWALSSLLLQRARSYSLSLSPFLSRHHSRPLPPLPPSRLFHHVPRRCE